jgi:hypothetical protein
LLENPAADMKIFNFYTLALSLMLCCRPAGMAQNPVSKAPSDATIAGYLASVNEWAVIFNGKAKAPHTIVASTDIPPGYSYHPYLVSPDYGTGDIRYNYTSRGLKL